jgi:hypothetical protein
MQNIRASLLTGHSERVPRRLARALSIERKIFAMSDPTERRDAARRTAQSHFTHTERRDEMVRAEIAKERAAVDAKTARLRALRLAKEASEKAEAERLSQERAKSGAGEQKKPRKKPSRAA